MPIGRSGRVVIEIDPELKQELYASLEAEGLSLKYWFLGHVDVRLKDHRQMSLDLETLDEDRGGAAVPMRFNAEKTAFGRHETFALRFGWLTKGAQALMSGDPVFEAEDATVLLGVGKNMVSSIRYWLQAARIIERNDSGWTLTKIGEYIFDDEGYDPYLEDEATIWLLHWLIASNPELATTWWWFFNRFHKPEFTGAELTTALQDFVRDEVKGRTSASTLKTDSEVLRRIFSVKSRWRTGMTLMQKAPNIDWPSSHAESMTSTSCGCTTMGNGLQQMPSLTRWFPRTHQSPPLSEAVGIAR
jgi:hypothetical protein